MTEAQRATRIAWGIGAFGFLITPVVYISARLKYGADTVAAVLVDYLAKQLAEGENLLLVAVLGAAPFAVLALIIRWLLPRLPSTRPARYALLAACGGALLAMTLATVEMHWSIWQDLYAGPATSTASIGFVLLPVLLLVVVPIAAALCGAVGAVVGRLRA